MVIVRPPEEQLHIEYVPLDEVTTWDRNPKDHDIGQINASISRFGFVQPLVYDERAGRIVAGHGRLEALVLMRESGATPPKRIRVLGDGRWAVPVVRGVSFNSGSEADAYGIADNRLVELGGWHADQLATVLGQLLEEGGPENLTGSGYDADDLDDLLKDLESEKDRQRKEDDGGASALGRAEELLEKWHVQTGDVWRIPAHNLHGAHLVMCGSSTDIRHVEALVKYGGRGANAKPTIPLLATDPPYNIGVAYGEETDDAQTDDEYRTFCLDWFTCWQGFTERQLITPGTKNLGVWLKIEPPYHIGPWLKTNAMTGGKVSAFQCWEPVLFYGRGWSRKRHSEIFDFPVPPQSAPGMGSLTPFHPCPKPLPMWEELLSQYSEPGDPVADGFGGSGTALIAAENTGRLARIMEIEPKYVAVILERAQGLGMEPKLT